MGNRILFLSWSILFALVLSGCAGSTYYGYPPRVHRECTFVFHVAEGELDKVEHPQINLVFLTRKNRSVRTENLNLNKSKTLTIDIRDATHIRVRGSNRPHPGPMLFNDEVIEIGQRDTVEIPLRVIEPRKVVIQVRDAEGKPATLHDFDLCDDLHYGCEVQSDKNGHIIAYYPERSKLRLDYKLPISPLGRNVRSPIFLMNRGLDTYRFEWTLPAPKLLHVTAWLEENGNRIPFDKHPYLSYLTGEIQGSIIKGARNNRLPLTNGKGQIDMNAENFARHRKLVFYCKDEAYVVREGKIIDLDTTGTSAEIVLTRNPDRPEED